MLGLDYYEDDYQDYAACVHCCQMWDRQDLEDGLCWECRKEYKEAIQSAITKCIDVIHYIAERYRQDDGDVEWELVQVQDNL